MAAPPDSAAHPAPPPPPPPAPAAYRDDDDHRPAPDDDDRYTTARRPTVSDDNVISPPRRRDDHPHDDHHEDDRYRREPSRHPHHSSPRAEPDSSDAMRRITTTTHSSSPPPPPPSSSAHPHETDRDVIATAQDVRDNPEASISDRHHHPRAIFVGNFAPHARTSDIESLFAAHGTVARVDLKRNFAFVFMATEEDGRAVISAIDGLSNADIAPRPLKVEWARGDGIIKRREDERRRHALTPSDTLFVVNFDPRATSHRDLFLKFEPFGRVVRLDMQQRFAFVQFASIEQATAAMKALHNSVLDDRHLIVEYTARASPPVRRAPSYRTPYNRPPMRPHHQHHHHHPMGPPSIHPPAHYPPPPHHHQHPHHAPHHQPNHHNQHSAARPYAPTYHHHMDSPSRVHPTSQHVRDYRTVSPPYRRGRSISPPPRYNYDAARRDRDRDRDHDRPRDRSRDRVRPRSHSRDYDRPRDEKEYRRERDEPRERDLIPRRSSVSPPAPAREDPAVARPPVLTEDVREAPSAAAPDDSRRRRRSFSRSPSPQAKRARPAEHATTSPRYEVNGTAAP